MALTTKERDDLLEQIHKQTVRTNGRVTRVEEEVFGDPAHGTPGLIADMRQIKSAVYDARAVARAMKWALPLVGSGSIAAIVSATKAVW